MIHVTLHRHLTYPSPKREATALRPVELVIRDRSLVRFTVAKITRRTNINANIDPTITPALEDVGSASMTEKNTIHSLYSCYVQNALWIFFSFLYRWTGGPGDMLFIFMGRKRELLFNFGAAFELGRHEWFALRRLITNSRSLPGVFLKLFS